MLNIRMYSEPRDMREHKRLSCKVMLLLLGIFSLSTQPAVADTDKNAARVGDSLITESEILGAMDSTSTGSQTSKQAALDRLVQRNLFAEQARIEKLDQDADVLAAIEAARKRILAQAYVAKLADGVSKPSADDVSEYYQAHPALFSQRSVYTLQEITIVGNAIELQRASAQYEKINTFSDMVEWLESNDIRYALSNAVKGAEEMPADFLPTLLTLKPGQVVKVRNEQGLSILQLTDKRDEPVTLEQSTPVIEQFLLNRTLGDELDAAAQKLREKVKVVYYPPYSQ